MVKRLVGDRELEISADAEAVCSCIEGLEEEVHVLSEVMDRISEILSDMYKHGVG